MQLAVKTLTHSKTKARQLPALTLAQNGEILTFSGDHFNVAFNRAAGTLVSMKFGGEEMLAKSTNGFAGPVLQLYRAPTDNDKGFGHWLARDWHEAGLDRLARRLDSCKFSQPRPDVAQVRMVATSSSLNGGYTLATTWTIHGDGSIEMDNQFSPFGKLPATLPRISVVMRLGGAFENFRWYGRGPWENYPDRKQSADMGVWSSTVNDQYVPYIRPQENGNKEDVRWLELTGANGRGLRVESLENPMAVSALHFTVADLTAVKHYYELKPRREVVLSLDAKQCGLGNGSCGPGVLEKYAVPPKSYSLKLRLSAARASK
jgi:beta-galactosidase